MEVFSFFFFFFPPVFQRWSRFLATMVGDERIIGEGGAVWLWKNWRMRCFFFPLFLLEVEVL